MGAGVQAALEQLASAPVDQIAITELDIANSPVADYTAVVQGCLNVAKCSAVTVWGVSDKVCALASSHLNALLTRLASRILGERVTTLCCSMATSNQRRPTTLSSASCRLVQGRILTTTLTQI